MLYSRLFPVYSAFQSFPFSFPFSLFLFLFLLLLVLRGPARPEQRGASFFSCWQGGKIRHAQVHKSCFHHPLVLLPPSPPGDSGFVHPGQEGEETVGLVIGFLRGQGTVVVALQTVAHQEDVGKGGRRPGFACLCGGWVGGWVADFATQRKKSGWVGG